MILGTVVGVVQTNVKRMLAYSSIAHAGYLLLGDRRGERRPGKAAVLFYLLAYAVTNLGALGIVALLGTPQHAARRAARLCRAVEDRGPAWPALMTVFLLSLGGFPPTAGFIAKWYIFAAAVERRLLLAGDHRRADERRLGLLLPAHRRHDVHDGGERDRASARARPWRWPAWRSRRWRCCTSASCRRGSSTSRSIRSRRFSEPSCFTLPGTGVPVA